LLDQRVFGVKRFLLEILRERRKRLRRTQDSQVIRQLGTRPLDVTLALFEAIGHHGSPGRS
jgi:hypothetical protein